jgi:hypothetical protein
MFEAQQPNKQAKMLAVAVDQRNAALNRICELEADYYTSQVNLQAAIQHCKQLDQRIADLEAEIERNKQLNREQKATIELLEQHLNRLKGKEINLKPKSKT